MSITTIHPELVESYGEGYDFWLFDGCDTNDIGRWSQEAWEDAEHATTAEEIEQWVHFARACDYELDSRLANLEPDYSMCFEEIPTVKSYSSIDMLRDAAKCSARVREWYGHSAGVVSSCIDALTDLMELIEYNHMYECSIGIDAEMYQKLRRKREMLKDARTPKHAKVAMRQRDVYYSAKARSNNAKVDLMWKGCAASCVWTDADPLGGSLDRYQPFLGVGDEYEGGKVTKVWNFCTRIEAARCALNGQVCPFDCDSYVQLEKFDEDIPF